MAKFKKVNIAALAARECVKYSSIDLLRQTSIKQFVERCGNRANAAQVKDALLNNIRILLNKMVVDEKPSEPAGFTDKGGENG